MPNIKYQSRRVEITTDGVMTSLAYYGTREEMVALQSQYPVGVSSPEGRLRSTSLSQSDGSIWQLELLFESDSTGSYAVGPSTEYGRRSATLSAAMLSLPLESHEDYRTCWNYFLAAAPDVTYSPVWALTATDTLLSAEDSQLFAWIKSPSELPMVDNRRWRIALEPEMKGIENYEVATYTIRESIRCRTQAAAGELVEGRINGIGAPTYTFGIRGGNWKCDLAEVSWHGKYWLASLTWTRSGDDGGWNRKLYKKEAR